jgi:hypothetical protein
MHKRLFLILSIILKKCHNPEPKESLSNNIDNWSDFIGCVEAEPDLSINYKSYLNQESRSKAMIIVDTGFFGSSGIVMQIINLK